MAISDIFKGSRFDLSKRAKGAVSWLRDLMGNLRGGKPKPQEYRDFETVSNVEIGKMYFYMYDAKYKAVLPYWDSFPLIFCIDINPKSKSGKTINGFMGINLHYLPPRARAQMMDSLMTIANNKKLDDSTKLNISYRYLKAYANQFSGFEECVKIYLYEQVRSQFYYIRPDAWETVAMLPLQQWNVNSGKAPY